MLDEQYGIQRSESLRIIKFRIILVHVASLGVFLVPFDISLLYLFLITYFIRTFGWEAGSHRYFSHRSFKTSRVFQFILAILAASGGQRGPIWWATTHRLHHKYSDTENDLHSPVHLGFFYSHFCWYIDAKNIDTDLDKAKDLSKYKELRLINKYHYLFPYLLLVIIFILGEYTNIIGDNVSGLSAVFWGFFLSTLLSLHATFIVNTLMHRKKFSKFYYRNFSTNDYSVNNVFFSIITMGASLHNNHHRHMTSANNSVYWWEFDPSYFILKLLSFFHIVWDLRETPKDSLVKESELVSNHE